MKNKIIIAIVAVAIVAVLGYLVFNAGPIVSAQGTSVVKAQPDEVSVYLSVETRALTAEEAKDANKEISDALLIELIKLGFDRDELKFINYNVGPEYDRYYGSGKIKGYIVSQQLVVKLKNFEKVAEVIDSSVSAGALVNSINFELSQEKQNEYKAQALEEAGQDAEIKAKATAKGLGKSLGRIVSIDSQQFNYYPTAYYAKGMEDAVASNMEAQRVASTLASLGPQDMEVSATISVVYKTGLF